jgi:hypothetical protein
MKKPPVGAGNILPLVRTVILYSYMLEISSGLWSKAFSVLLRANSGKVSN